METIKNSLKTVAAKGILYGSLSCACARETVTDVENVKTKKTRVYDPDSVRAQHPLRIGKSNQGTTLCMRAGKKGGRKREIGYNDLRLIRYKIILGDVGNPFSSLYPGRCFKASWGILKIPGLHPMIYLSIYLGL